MAARAAGGGEAVVVGGGAGSLAGGGAAVTVFDGVLAGAGSGEIGDRVLLWTAAGVGAADDAPSGSSASAMEFRAGAVAACIGAA